MIDRAVRYVTRSSQRSVMLVTLRELFGVVLVAAARSKLEWCLRSNSKLAVYLQAASGAMAYFIVVSGLYGMVKWTHGKPGLRHLSVLALAYITAGLSVEFLTVRTGVYHAVCSCILKSFALHLFAYITWRLCKRFCCSFCSRVLSTCCARIAMMASVVILSSSALYLATLYLRLQPCAWEWDHGSYYDFVYTCMVMTTLLLPVIMWHWARLWGVRAKSLASF